MKIFSWQAVSPRRPRLARPGRILLFWLAALGAAATLAGQSEKAGKGKSPEETITDRMGTATSPAEETGEISPATDGAPGTPGDDREADVPDESAEDDVEPMSERFERWLDEVDPLITSTERGLFLSLRKDYQRDAFIHQFWKVRDPFPRTPRNELKERWPYRLAEAKSNYGDLEDDRARILLVHGKPAGKVEVRCTKKYSVAEVWVYDGTDQFDVRIPLIFVRPSPRDAARLWNPGRNYMVIDAVMRRARSCINGAQLQQVMGLVNSDLGNYQRDLQRMLVKPRPRSLEWVHTFVAHSTDMPHDARPMPAELDFGFLGRHQNRTVVQGLLNVPAQEIAVGEYAGYRSHDLLLTGEVILGDSLFESFRYKFGFPEEMAPGSVPLIFQRYLRPGEYKLILKLEDLNSDGVFRTEQTLTIPRSNEIFELPTFKDPRTEELFEEATAAIEAGETRIRLIPPRGDLQTGFVRFDSLVAGSEIEKVKFYLDDKLMVTRNRPPYNVEIDLGSYPDIHALRAEGLDADGVEVASDEILINAGSYRFAIKLVEPRKGQRYVRSLRARAEIEVPSDRALDRVEFYLNETLVATLFQEPWVQPIVLPANEEVAYVRTVAYLPDGNSTEDLVFINAPDYLEELEIQFVELYTTVLDKQGRPVDGLVEDAFDVFEDGVRQDIARFERVEDLPIHVGILIDNSASMVGVLDEVRKAALSFFQQAIKSKDRAAVITFNNFPHLAVELTNDRLALGSGLAGLIPEGKTALYDSVMFSLYYFAGIKGQRAILILSDGKDEASRFEFDDLLDYARRAGITIYAVGFRLGDGLARGRLGRLAQETGGSSYFIHDIQQLGAIYAQIQRELRSQYLIAYQSKNTSQEDTFRTVDLKVDRRDVEVKTLAGYYP